MGSGVSRGTPKSKKKDASSGLEQEQTKDGDTIQERSPVGGDAGDQGMPGATYSDRSVHVSSPEDEERINPAEYITDQEEIVYSGVVFRQKGYANGESKWLPRKMWITDSGGLFYYSHQYDKPLGGAIIGMQVSVPSVEPRQKERYEFVVVSTDTGVLNAKPTVFATTTAEQRDAWVKHLSDVREMEEREGGHDLDPLEGFTRTGTEHRLRLHTLNSEATASAAAAAVLAADGGKDAELVRKRRSRIGTIEAHRLQQMSEADEDQEQLEEAGRRVMRCATDPFGKGVKDAVAQEYVQKSMSLCKMSPNLGVEQTEQLADLAKMVSEGRGPEIRRDSRAMYSKRDHTMLVLDWDDTIFPTTFVRKDCGLDWRRSIQEQVLPGPGRVELEALFVRLTECMERFITMACSLATVVIVTLAKPPWVLTSCDNFLPAFRPLMEKFKIKIIYARECMTEEMRREYAANAFKSSDQEADFWMRAKAAAMEREITEMYKSRGASWKNIISIGDSDFERVALIATAESHVRSESSNAHVIETGLTSEFISKEGHVQRLRAKTVKMLEDPSLEELIAQQTLLATWLPHLLNRDQGTDIVIQNSEDDAQLNDMHRFVTGEDADLSWLKLAGVEPE